MKPDLEKENECPSVETYTQYTEQDLDKMSSSRLGSKSVLNSFKSY